MRKNFILPILLLMLFIPMCMTLASPTATVTGLRWTTRTDAATHYVRIVLDLDRIGQASATIDSTGTNVQVTLKNANMQGIPTRYTLNPDIAKSLIISKKDRDLTLNITTPNAIAPADVSVFSLKRDDDRNKPARLVIDVKQKTALQPVAKPVNYRVTPGLEGKTITIDPGHGGSDTGAIGPGNVYEKNITLPISMKLKCLLENAGAKVVMTRTTDVDVYGPNASDRDELQARVNVAENAQSDAFVCIHIDAFVSPDAGGMTAYYTAKTPYDRALASYIHAQNLTAVNFGDRGVQENDFYVLRNTSMPATLVELGFISNPKQEMALITDAVQAALAQSIFQGLKDYFDASGQ